MTGIDLPPENIDSLCPSCAGMGWIDVGDCEDGITDTCPECDGTGEINE